MKDGTSISVGFASRGSEKQTVGKSIPRPAVKSEVLDSKVLPAQVVASETPVSLEDSQPYTSESDKLRAIAEVFKQNKFVLQTAAPKLPFRGTCDSLREDITNGTNIEAIEPTVRGTEYNDPVFNNYHLQCPAQDGTPMRFAYIPRDRKAGATSEGHLLKDIRGYVLDIDGDPKNGDEYVFYAEGFQRIRQYGKVVDPVFAVNGYTGKFVVADLKQCTVQNEFYAYGTYDYYKKERLLNSSLLVKYDGRPYLLFYQRYGNLFRTIYIVDPSDKQWGFHPIDLASCVYKAQQ